MTTLTLIAEPMPNWEADAQRAAARDLTKAVADVAPRACGARYLAARGAEVPEFTSPLVQTARLPMKAHMLTTLWQSGAAARPLDGEFVHTLTPLAPLRMRGGDDDSQTSVTVPHLLAWEAPHLFSGSAARFERAFVKRAARFADVVITGNHATADAIRDRFGSSIPVQVLPLAAPSEFLTGRDAAAVRQALALPEKYAVTTASLGTSERLAWIFEAMLASPELPPLVILSGLDPVEASFAKAPEGAAYAVPEGLVGRVAVLPVKNLALEQHESFAGIGAVLGGAQVLLQPQEVLSAGYTVLGALASAVPVLHAGNAAVAELTLDGGVAATTPDEFVRTYRGLVGSGDRLDQLSILAGDRGRGFGWRDTAWQLWETHANL